jgi:hypothetical protein
MGGQIQSPGMSPESASPVFLISVEYGTLRAPDVLILGA